MLRRVLFLLVLIAAVAAGPASGGPDALPDMALSYAWREYAGPEILTLMINPYGEGPYFNQASLPDGTLADGTIHLVLLDPTGNPIYGYPREDIWLDDPTSTLIGCGIFELIADSDTDRDGRTVWFQRPRGGGYSNESLQVYVSGSPLLAAPLPLRIYSPDINGDRRVNLGDAALFAQDLFGEYHIRSDLHPDGIINLSDVPVMARWYGGSCAPN